MVFCHVILTLSLTLTLNVTPTLTNSNSNPINVYNIHKNESQNERHNAPPVKWNVEIRLLFLPVFVFHSPRAKSTSTRIRSHFPRHLWSLVLPFIRSAGVSLITTSGHIGLCGTTSVHVWAAKNFHNNAVIKSLSAARCNSQTALLTLPALRGDFVINEIIQNSRLWVASAMWTRLLKLPLTASLLVWSRFVLVFSAVCLEQRSFSTT